MTWGETFERMAEHYTAMAMQPGCWQYAQARVAELEQSDLWQGLAGGSGQADQGGWLPAQPERSCPVRARAAAVIRTTAQSLGLTMRQEGAFPGRGEVFSDREYQRRSKVEKTNSEALA